jgi:hypothetical protein
MRQQAMQPPLQQNMPPPPPVPSHYANFQQPSQPPVLPANWFASTIAAPQASHPATMPQAPQPQQERTPPIQADQWDELYLSVLSSQDPSKLRDILSRTNPELIMPSNGTPLVSQAVILTLVHRVSETCRSQVLLYSIAGSFPLWLGKHRRMMKFSKHLYGGSSDLSRFFAQRYVSNIRIYRLDLIGIQI